jgi:predicted PurR-regulated permease PerM
MTPSTDRERLGALAFYGVAVVLAYLVYQLFQPFLVPLAWAAVLAICFYPTHRRFEERFGRSGAALLSTASVAVLIIVPLLGVASAFISEASELLGTIPELLSDMPVSAQRWLQTALEYVPGGETIDPAALLADSARRVAAFLSAQVAGILQDVVVFVVNMVITLFALFFLFRDGPAVMAAIRRVIPLESAVRERLILQTSTMVTTSVASSLVVAAVQGLLSGVTFWILGLSAPVFWGVVTAVFCLLPFGAWVVWAPAAIWLVFTGNVVRGLVLAGVGAGIVSAVDNILRPFLMSERSEMNGLLLLISLLGGVIAFGSVGLVAGPVLMAIALVLFDALTSDHRTTTVDTNGTET